MQSMFKQHVSRGRYQCVFACIVFVACLLTTPPSSAFAADETQATGGNESALVFMGPECPVFLKMQIQVDRKPFDQWLTTFLFSALDHDKNGSLSQEEIAVVPVPILTSDSAANSESVFKNMDAAPTDEKVTAEEFRAAMRPDQGDLFSIVAETQSQASVVQLLPFIDRNSDGSLSEEEFASGTDTLARRDLDDDETFSPAELLPFSDPLNRTAVAVSRTADLPFLTNSEQTMELLVERIQARYETGRSQKLTADTLKIPAREFAKFDADKNGEFSSEELQKFLRKPVTHAVISISIAGKGYVRPTATADVADFAQDWIKVQKTTVGRREYQQLLVNNIPLDLRPAGGALTRRNDSWRFTSQRFYLADADKNKYLNEDEYMALAGMVQLPVGFEMADTNSDGMVFREELKTSIDRNSMIGQSRVVMKVRREGGSLFQMLDNDKDNRLSRREFRSGFAQAAELDRNKDGLVADTELTSQFVLRFELSKPTGIPASSMVNMNQSADARVPAVSSLSGPRWFARMDRNRDGDVSLREFPGPEEAFRRVDADGDGLINAEEAEAVEN